MNETRQIINSHPYISFMVIGIGIEFLGKCIDTNEQNWNQQGNSRGHFKLAINDLNSFSIYKPFLETYDLYGSFRCGLVHAASPKYSVTLSSKDEAPNLSITNSRLNLKVEDLYHHFYNACDEVINMTFPITDKMNSPFLEVPIISDETNTMSVSGTTNN